MSTWPILLVLALALQLAATQTQAPGGRGQQPPGPLLGGRRGGPPQPQQQQGVEYFAGAWTFTYTGRESPVTSGPRSGTVTFSRRGSSNVLEVRTEGQIEGGEAFRDTGTFEWNDADKQMTMTERLVNGTEITSVGNWSSPLTMRAESRPVQVGGQSVRLRRVYSIVSAQAFTMSEDISLDGGPFQRLGAGQFSKAVK
jgi:hypothetical protein